MSGQNERLKWEYKVVNIQNHRTPTGVDVENAAKVAALLNASGQEGWELLSTIHPADQILPEGFVVSKRLYQAPKPEPKRLFPARPKVAVPAAVKPPAK